jgi:D-3-phosphoglycerate dehydrogenase
MKILHLDSNHSMIKKSLSALGLKNDIDLTSSKVEIGNIIGAYHGLVLRSRIKIDKDLIDKAVNLKFVARVGSGTENIDCKYLVKKNIELITSGEGNSNAVGEHTLGLLLDLSKKITKSHIEMQNNLRKREENRGFEIEGKTIGIIGYGKAGKSFARKLLGFNCNVIFNDLKKDLEDEYAKSVTISELKEKSDIISIHTDLNKLSHHLINKKFINDCKKPFYLLNTSRGECVNTEDLIFALKDGKVSGAGLDVLENETKSFFSLNDDDSFEEIKKFENVILTPHTAGWSN